MVERVTMTVAEAQSFLPDLTGHLKVAGGNAKEIVADLIEEGREFLRTLREEQKCPVCQTGKVSYTPAVSCGIEYHCDNHRCGEPYVTEVKKPDPPFFDSDDELLRFGWRIHQARGRLAKRQAKS